MNCRASWLAVAVGILWYQAVCAQEVRVNGVVRDRNTHEPIPSVNVFLKNSQIGTVTDELGVYYLSIPQRFLHSLVRFQHVSYEAVDIPVDSLVKQHDVYLQPRIIPLPEIAVEEFSDRPVSLRFELPQPVEVVQARRFSMKGFVDAGDLLRTDQSVQVEENLSGKKTIGIRGGNPDEVVVLFNGIKLNRAFDNIFDFSLMDLEDIRHVEIIRGSHTVLFGPEAFSGVVNVVPKLKHNYSLRFLQRIGTYNSGNWGLYGFRQLGSVYGSVSVKKGAWQRRFVDVPSGQNLLINESTHYFANVNWEPKAVSGKITSLGAMALITKLTYENQRNQETVTSEQRLISLRFSGRIPFLQHVVFSLAHRNSPEQQALSIYQPGDFRRKLNDKSTLLNLESHRSFGNVELLTAYQLESTSLDFTDTQKTTKYTSGLESARLQRTHHGLVGIFRYHGKTDSEFFKSLDLDLSLRHDRLYDEQKNAITRGVGTTNSGPGVFGENRWISSLVKFSMNLYGYRSDLKVDSYITIGRNIKFPTLFQQISSPMVLTDLANRPRLEPEVNTSLEIGSQIIREYSPQRVLYGWQLSANYFQNQYDNKFRMFASPGVPIAFYDNTQNAKISGIDTRVSFFLFQKKVTAELGVSRYFITEKAAFSFKSDFKAVANLLVDLAGYSLQLHLFKESEQVGWLRFPNGQFAEITLPGQVNMDVHMSKKMKWWHFHLFGNLSARNLLSDDTTLQGLAIRDRRYYLSIGIQL